MPILFSSKTKGYEWLSNFYPCEILWLGMRFPSVEHAYQATKSFNPDIREEIRLARTASQAKRIGAGVTVREDWSSIKVGVMTDLCKQKFAPGLGLHLKLLATKEPLFHLSPWDTFWGVDTRGSGLNKLGEILMQIRTNAQKNK